MKIVPIILAGGSGSRLWPLSRQAYPKQFLPLVKTDETLLQSTVLRVMNNELMQAPIIVCHEDHRFIVAEQLRQIDVQPQAIILEPAARNTAPAIALAANYVKTKLGDMSLCVMPADHVIHEPKALLRALKAAKANIAAGDLLTFGVQAREPNTAYGYIKVVDADTHQGIYKIEQFIEKPSLAAAKEYVHSGQYYWNCGIFAFRADAYLQELQHFDPTMAQLCHSAIEQMSLDGCFVRPNRELFSSCRSDSIDYAVMEKTDKSAMVLFSTQWNDIGSWDALMREHTADKQGNVKVGDVVTIEVSNSYLRTENKLLAVAGVTDHVIVVTDDAVLVAHKGHSQHIKQLVNELKSQKRPETETHLKVHRPWGSYQTLTEGPYFKVKKIIVNPKQSLSLQRHQHRSEHWVVIMGEATIVNGEQHSILHANESTFIPPNTQHRLANLSDKTLELIEVQVGDYLGEDDIERLADVYNRTRV